MFYSIGVGLLITALAIFWLGIRAKQGLERNYIMGVRTRATMESDEVFTLANQVVWKGYPLIAGIVFLQAICCFLFEPYKISYETITWLLILTSTLILMIALGQVYIANKVAKAL